MTTEYIESLLEEEEQKNWAQKLGVDEEDTIWGR